MLADLVDLHDVGVVQASDRFGLGMEPRQVLRAGVRAGLEHLQDHDALQLLMPRPVDHTRGAPS